MTRLNASLRTCLGWLRHATTPSPAAQPPANHRPLPRLRFIAPVASLALIGLPAISLAQSVADRPTGSLAPHAAPQHTRIETETDITIAPDRAVTRLTRTRTTILTDDGARQLTESIQHTLRAQRSQGLTITVTDRSGIPLLHPLPLSQPLAASTTHPGSNSTVIHHDALSRPLASGDQITVSQRTVRPPPPNTADIIVVERLRHNALSTLHPDAEPHRITVRYPVALALEVHTEAALGPDGSALPGERTESQDGATRVTRWETLVPPPRSLAPDSIESGRTTPRLVVSTLRALEQVASAWAQRLDHLGPAPQLLQSWIDALARDITLGSKTPKDQAIAVDTWMKRAIRLLPADAPSTTLPVADLRRAVVDREATPTTAAVLMQRLLRARGLTAHLALANTQLYRGHDRALTMFDLDEPLQLLVHAPALDLWLAPADGTAAPGTLPLGAYDKPAILLPDEPRAQPVPTHIPAMRPADHGSRTVTRLAIARDGTVSGETHQEFSGVLAALARAWAQTQTLATDATAGAKTVAALAMAWETPATGTLKSDSPSARSDPFRITATFTYEKKWPSPRRTNMPLPTGLPVLGRLGLGLTTAQDPFRQEAFFCLSGHQTERIELTFDPDYPRPTLPPNRDIETPHLTFNVGYKWVGRTLIVERTFESRMPSQACPHDFPRHHAEQLHKIDQALRAYLPFGPGNISSGEPGNPPKRQSVSQNAHRSQ